MAGFKPYKLSLNDLDISIPKNKRKEALEEAAVYLKEAVLDYIGEGASPVSGGKWVKSLSKEYAQKKSETSSASFANLESSGEFLNSLEVTPTSNGFEFTIGEEFYGRAEGFLTGLYGESSKIKPREFLPQGDEDFKQPILRRLKAILSEYDDV